MRTGDVCSYYMDELYGTIFSMKRWGNIKESAISLYKKGKTFSEIQELLGVHVPKSTMSVWLTHMPLSFSARQRLIKARLKHVEKARIIAHRSLKEKRIKYLEGIFRRNVHLGKFLEKMEVAKIVLAVLYVTEGSKVRRGSIMFGNSDPDIIRLFLRLLRTCYTIDEAKFRCTVQCRADQNIPLLEKFWSRTTKIPNSQFYKAQVDPRSKGKISKKPHYKGVCRIDYFSGELFWEFYQIGKILMGR